MSAHREMSARGEGDSDCTRKNQTTSSAESRSTPRGSGPRRPPRDCALVYQQSRALENRRRTKVLNFCKKCGWDAAWLASSGSTRSAPTRATYPVRCGTEADSTRFRTAADSVDSLPAFDQRIGKLPE